MLAPQAVHHGDDNATLEGTNGLIAQLRLRQRVGVQAVLGIRVDGVDVADQLGHQIVAHEGRSTTMLLLDLFDRDRRRVVGAQVLPQGGQIPLVHGLIGDRFVDKAGHEGLHERAHLRAHVLALKHLAAFGVDRLTLTRHDVVVLQDVLTDLEVAGFHLALGRRDRTRHHAVLQRHILRIGTRGHDALRHARVE